LSKRSAPTAMCIFWVQAETSKRLNNGIARPREHSASAAHVSARATIHIGDPRALVCALKALDLSAEQANVPSLAPQAAPAVAHEPIVDLESAVVPVPHELHRVVQLQIGLVASVVHTRLIRVPL